MTDVAVQSQPIIDLTDNKNQSSFFNEVMLAVAHKSDKRIFGYGGAIRGGKTYVCLFIFILLAKMFPGSRWHVIREDMPALRATTIPEMEKLIAGSSSWRWSRDSSNYYCEYHNGSKIFFKGQNFSLDKELTAFLGLATNGILLEQCEEIEEKMFNMALSRTGSWVINPMPIGIILLTTNPTQNWFKGKIYIPFLKKNLPKMYHFQPALPKDNKYVTQDQWDIWGLMDERNQKQFIQGDWTNFDDKNNRWAYAFSREKHVGLPELSLAHELYLSWDFNRNPLCCSVIQWYDNKVNILKCYKISNTGVDDICDRIRIDYPNMIYIVNGDYSGIASNTLTREVVTNYTMIKAKLMISAEQIQLTPNPPLFKNRTLMNSLLQNYPIQIHEVDAAPVIWDMENVRSLADGKIEKRDRTDEAQQADCFVGETLLKTNGPDKRIDNIKIGDMLLTRKGYRSVIDKWSSQAQVWDFEFSDGTKITCTKDHKFYNNKQGFIPIFTIFTENLSVWKLKSNITGLHGQSTQNKNTFTARNLFLKLNHYTQNAFTGKSGLMLSGQYQRALTFITKTVTHSIMSYQITKLRRQGSIKATMLKRGLLKTLNSLLNFKRWELQLLLSGTGQKKESSGIGNMQLIMISGIGRMDLNHVNHAGRSSRLKGHRQSSAQTIASRHIGERIIPIRKRLPVLPVESGMKHSNIYHESIVPSIANPHQIHTELKVIKATFKGTQTVYDITVDEDHEFYANGILVHNCLDTIRYFANKNLAWFLKL